MDTMIGENGMRSRAPTPGSSAPHSPYAKASPAKWPRRYKRLAAWAFSRLLWSLIGLSIPILILVAEYQNAASWSLTTATVVESHFSGHQFNVNVNLISPDDGTRIAADIQPKSLKVARPGQRILVRYYHHGPGKAVLYAGPGGDVRQVNYNADYAIIAVLIIAAAIPLVTALIRCLRMLAAANAPIKTQLDVVEINAGRWARRVRAREACSGMDLEWRVLRWQSDVSGAVSVGGRVECGCWLVIELPGKKFIWPGSRAQPVIGTGMQEVLRNDPNVGPVINAHHRLLASYAQLISEIDQLPFMVRRQPGRQVKSKWWGFGAPRPVVRSLVTTHIRRRLQALANALIRAGALTGVIYYGTTRSALYTAGEECKALAATLPRSTWRAVTAFLIITALPAALTVYTAFIQAAPIHVKFTIPHYLLLVTAIFITFIAPLMFTRSLWCKRLLFRPALNSQLGAALLG